MGSMGHKVERASGGRGGLWNLSLNHWAKPVSWKAWVDKYLATPKITKDTFLNLATIVQMKEGRCKGADEIKQGNLWEAPDGELLTSELGAERSFSAENRAKVLQILHVHS